MRTCDGMSDDCTLIASTTRDTSDGHLPLEHFCAACAADYDERMANYDPPDADGEAFCGREAAAYWVELMDDQAQRLK